MPRARSLTLLSLLVAWPLVAGAQARPRPEWGKGHKLRVKIDSTPQQAAIYIDSKDYGIQGYTPSEFRLPKGSYKFIVELQGWKPAEQSVTLSRSQGFAFTLEKQARPAILDVRAATDASALGGAIPVDGQPVGSVPNQVEVAAGSHLVEVKRQGYNDYRDSVQVQEGERRTMVVALVAQVKPGSLLVTADVAGAEVWVDGQRKDIAPALIGDLAEGDHTVEVRKDPLPAWKQLVRVAAGQQTKVIAQLQAAVAATGSLKVISSTPMSNVIVDGDPKGPANAEVKEVRPGTHIVELRADGFEAKRVEVEVKAGELRVIPLDLSPARALTNARLRVISPVPDVEVFLDGASIGKAPIDRNDLSPGKHFVVARKEGFAEYKVEVELSGGKPTEVTVNLSASGTIRVVSNPPGASILLDGAAVGTAPATLSDVPVGDHVLELKMRDFLDGRQTVRVDGGRQTLTQLDLQPMNHGPTVGELQTRQREQSSFGALTVDRFKFNVDIGFGHPYFFGARVITGMFKVGGFGADIGIELRTNFYETDVGLRPRVQFFRADPIAVGLDLTVLGGGGPTKRNSFTFEIGPILTLIAGSYVHINFKPYLGYWSDRLCPSVSDIKDDDTQNGSMMGGMPVPGSGPLYKSEDQGGEKSLCKVYDTKRPGDYFTVAPTNPNMTKFGQNDPRERFGTTRFMLQGSLEIAVSNGLSLWLLVEGAPGQDQRQAFTSKFNNWFTLNDFPFYARFGFTGKF